MRAGKALHSFRVDDTYNTQEPSLQALVFFAGSGLSPGAWGALF